MNKCVTVYINKRKRKQMDKKYAIQFWYVNTNQKVNNNSNNGNKLISWSSEERTKQNHLHVQYQPNKLFEFWFLQAPFLQYQFSDERSKSWSKVMQFLKSQ